jgi:predicted HTH domain antitoxin
MNYKYKLTDNDIEIIKNNYKKVPNVELLKMLESDCSRGILVYTAKKLGIRSNRDVVLKEQNMETYEKMMNAINIIENKQSDSFEHAAELADIHPSTFSKKIKKYPKLLEKFNNIQWNDVFNLYCSECNVKLSIENYRRINNITASRGANKNRFRRCDCCYKQNLKKLKNTLRRRIGLMYSGAKTRSKQNNMEFDITKDDISKLWDTQRGKCFYTNDSMSYTPGHTNLVSIDRKDSNLGYTKNNICLTSWEVNQMKGNIPYEKFIKICRKISDNITV